jgi:hypothetical protein
VEVTARGPHIFMRYHLVPKVNHPTVIWREFPTPRDKCGILASSIWTLTAKSAPLLRISRTAFSCNRPDQLFPIPVPGGEFVLFRTHQGRSHSKLILRSIAYPTDVCVSSITFITTCLVSPVAIVILCINTLIFFPIFFVLGSEAVSTSPQHLPRSLLELSIHPPCPLSGDTAKIVPNLLINDPNDKAELTAAFGGGTSS